MKKLLIGAAVLALTSIPVFADTITIPGDGSSYNTTESIYSGNNGIYGGAVDSRGNFEVLTGVEFKENTAQYGGAISSVDGLDAYGQLPETQHSQLTINDNVQFNSNTSTVGGGAISIQNGLEATIKNEVSFDGNKSYCGGAIYTATNDVVVGNDNNFSGNIADFAGGAIYNGSSHLGTADMTIGSDAVVEDNSAMYGGGIYNFAYGGESAEMNIGTGASFSGNIASQSGGAIYNEDTSESKIVIHSGTSFTGNKATVDGGAIHNGSELVLDSTGGEIIFSNNSAATGKDVFIDENGTMYIQGDGKVSFQSGDKSISGSGDIVKQDSGTLEIVNNKDFDFTGNYTQTGGKLSLNNSNIFNKFDIQDGELELLNSSNVIFAGTDKILAIGTKVSIYDSTFNIGDGNLQGNISIDISMKIADGGIVNVKNGSLVLSGTDDTWDGNINTFTNGSLTLDKFTHQTSDGSYNQTGGELVLQNNSSLTLNDENSKITGGKVNIQTGTELGVQNKASISNAQINIDGDLKIGTGGNVTLTKDTTWNNGKVSNDGGNLTLNNVPEKQGVFTQTDGQTTIENEFVMNNSSDKISGGSLIVDGTLTQTTGEILADVLDIKGTLDVQGGKSTINKDWTGTVKVSDNGEVNFQDLTSNGVFQANGGTVNINSGDLTLANNSFLNDGTTTNISASSNLNIKDGSAVDGQINFEDSSSTMNILANTDYNIKAEISGSAGEINKNGSGNILFSGSTQDYEGNLTINNAGNLIFADEQGFGGNLILGDNIDGMKIGIIADTIQGSISHDRDVELTYSTYRDVQLKFGDTVNVTNGKINAIAKSGQNVSFAKDVNVTNAEMSVGGVNVNFAQNLNLSDAALNVVQNNFNANGINIVGNSFINLMNNSIGESVVTNGTTISDGSTANYTIDINSRAWTSDTFKSDFIGAGNINISDFSLLGKAPIDRHIFLGKVFKGEISEDINLLSDAPEKFTPIGWYKLHNSSATGWSQYAVSLVRYNPQVFRGQVATVAMWQNQLVTNDILFDHMQQVNLQYLAQENPNKYAAEYPQFAPYQYNKKDGSLWFKTYGTFERLSMTRGLDVDNNFYGALIGADFPAIEMKRGWTFMPTAYVAYNGSQQSFNHVSMAQNGGQGGFMGTFMKNDFMGSILAYGGGYGNQMDLAGTTDNTGNWFAGSAAKLAYNFHPTKHFVIQPTGLVSWNMFGEQRWYTNFGDMHMNSKMMNGINVAPGLNLIYGRETWSVYATIQYFYNIMGSCEGRAGNVQLPGVAMRHGFLQYGLGFTKTFKDRFSAYAQVVIRNVGRDGIGLQAGLMYRL